MAEILAGKQPVKIYEVYSTNGLEYHLILGGNVLMSFEDKDMAELFLKKTSESSFLSRLLSNSMKLERLRTPIRNMCLNDHPEATEEKFWELADRNEIEKIALYNTTIARLMESILNEK